MIQKNKQRTMTRGINTFDAQLPLLPCFLWMLRNTSGQEQLTGTSSAAKPRERSVFDYRVYRLNAQDHVDDLPRLMRCACDRDAVRRARLLQETQAVEVWQGARLVAKIAPPTNFADERALRQLGTI
jgi:hypothetical protein